MPRKKVRAVPLECQRTQLVVWDEQLPIEYPGGLITGVVDGDYDGLPIPLRAVRSRKPHLKHSPPIQLLLHHPVLLLGNVSLLPSHLDGVVSQDKTDAGHNQIRDVAQLNSPPFDIR